MKIARRNGLLIKILDLFFTLLEHTLVLFPVAIAVLVFMVPCQLPFSGSLLLSTCKGSGISFVFVRVVLAIFEGLVTSQMLIAAVLYAVVILLMTFILFWLEMDTVFHSKCESSAAIKRYRRVQVMEKLINSCVRERIFPLISVAYPIVQVFGAVALVKLHDTMEWSHLIFVMTEPLSVSIFGVLVFGLAGFVYSKSCRWIVSEKHGCTRSNKKDKIQRRELKSMMPLRIWFGSNFVDRLTSLVIQHFCFSQTVNLLLLI